MKRKEAVFRDWKSILSIKYNSDEFILEKGRSIDVEELNGSLLLKEGWCVSILTDIDGRLKVDNIFCQNDIVFVDLFKYYIQSSEQNVYLYSLTQCKFEEITLDKSDELIEKKNYEEYLKAQIQYLLQIWHFKNKLNFMNSAEKVEWFSSWYPLALENISHKYIASFLGMDPVTLSRILHKK